MITLCTSLRYKMAIRLRLLSSLRLLVCLLLMASTGLAATLETRAEPKIRVAFINPNKPGNLFWEALTDFMRAAAHDLNIELAVHYAGEGHLRASTLAQSILKTEPKPDYLVFIAQTGGIGSTLQAAEAANVRTFTINTNLLPADKSITGMPREKFRHWIGHMSPDDVQAGYMLGKILMQQYRTRYPDTPIELIGVSGTRDSTPAFDRNAGLEMAVAEAGISTRLNQIVFADWSTQDAYRKTSVLLKRYPQTRVLWAASDSMAVGMVDAARENKLTPGVDVFIGGVDWTDAGLTAIEQGELVASIGGHLMEGGWAMVLLHDYHHGRDFAPIIGTTIRSEMHAIDKSNVHAHHMNLIARNWNEVDFKRFSRALNPELKTYDFSFNTVFRNEQHSTPAPAQ